MCLHSVKHLEAGEVKTATARLCHHVDCGKSHMRMSARGNEAVLTAASFGNLLWDTTFCFYHIFNKGTIVLSAWHLALRTKVHHDRSDAPVRLTKCHFDGRA